MATQTLNHLILYMKRELSAILGLLLSVAIFAQKERNVTLTLSVDSFISSQEQTAYLYGYIGDECEIYDSVKIVPGKQKYRLRGYVPYESTLYLALSKRGPFKTSFLAHPGERLELQLTENDGERPGTLYKKLRRGSPANDELVKLWTRIYDAANRRIQIKDSMSIIGLPDEKIDQLGARLSELERNLNEFQKQMARSTSSPYVAKEAHFLLWKSIPNDEFKALRTSVRKRFPDYVPLHTQRWPKASEQSRRNTEFLFKVGQSRIAFAKSQMPVDSLSIGQVMVLTLTDSLGQPTPVSDYRGKFVLIEVWASWCRPCIQAMPNIIQAQRMFGDDFVCCAVTIDKSAHAWQQAIRSFGLQELHHYKGTDADGQILPEIDRLIPDRTIPRNYLLNREGKIIATDIYDEALISKLKRIIKKRPNDFPLYEND